MAATGIQACSLRELLRGMAAIGTADERAVTGVQLDSRATERGDLFIALPGHRRQGHAFIADAIVRGAAAAVHDAGVDGAALADARRAAAAAGVPLAAVAGLGQRAGEIAARYYGRPGERMTLVGVTGTNGKTSSAHFIAQALSSAGRRCGVIGTLGNGPYGDLTPSALTTPDAADVQDQLQRLLAAGCRCAVIEASSHGLEQGRLNAVPFQVALFTNLTRDHLDYHRDMQAYGEAKARLFTRPGLRTAVLNGDDPFGRALLARPAPGVRHIVYGLDEAADPAADGAVEWIRGHGLRLHARGLEMDVDTPWGTGRLRAALLGRFNARNVLGVLAVLLALGLPLEEALVWICGLKTVPGRMETLGATAGRPLVVVDYAHTPDALEQVLGALRDHARGRLWCVFGCGGERDPGKRPQMGAVAQRLSDRVVITDDNPRGEASRSIIDGILSGVTAPDKVTVIAARAAAIAHAIGQAGRDDVVLIAGKGHEQYQIVGTERRPFSDRAQAQALLREPA